MSILDLPNELILLIAEDLARSSEWNALAKTCRRLYRLLNLGLYQRDVRLHPIP